MMRYRKYTSEAFTGYGTKPSSQIRKHFDL